MLGERPKLVDRQYLANLLKRRPAGGGNTCLVGVWSLVVFAYILDTPIAYSRGLHMSFRMMSMSLYL